MSPPVDCSRFPWRVRFLSTVANMNGFIRYFAKRNETKRNGTLRNGKHNRSKRKIRNRPSNLDSRLSTLDSRLSTLDSPCEVLSWKSRSASAFPVTWPIGLIILCETNLLGDHPEVRCLENDKVQWKLGHWRPSQTPQYRTKPGTPCFPPNLVYVTGKAHVERLFQDKTSQGPQEFLFLFVFVCFCFCFETRDY